MPDERREFHKIRPASHTLLSVNCLYQMNTAECKGVFTKLRRKPSQALQPSLRNIDSTFMQVIPSAAQTSGMWGFAITPEGRSPVITENPRARARPITNGSPKDLFLRVSIKRG